MLTRKYRAAKVRAARAMAKLSHGVYTRAREWEIQNSLLYLPCYYFETAGTMRSESTVEKYAQVRESISKALGDKPEASVLDLGCNEGYYSLRLASEGFWVCGIDPDPNPLNVAKFLQQRYAVHRASFHQAVADKEAIKGLPTFDIVLFMSVFQKWCGQYGFPEARETLALLWEKTDRMMFFEMPDSLETDEAFKEAIPYMGETKDQCRDYILEMLGALSSCSVAWLADYHMDYRQEQRSLFALTRVSSQAANEQYTASDGQSIKG